MLHLCDTSPYFALQTRCPINSWDSLDSLTRSARTTSFRLSRTSLIITHISTKAQQPRPRR